MAVATAAGTGSRCSSPAAATIRQPQRQPGSSQQPAGRPGSSSSSSTVNGAATAAAAGHGVTEDAGADSCSSLVGDADRNALFSKYKHSVPHGIAQAQLVKQQQQLLGQLKQGIKVGRGLVSA